MTGSKLRSRLFTLAAFTRYNASLIFAGKFVYFLLLAIALFLVVIIAYTAEQDLPPGPAAIFYFLLAPGILLTFYPSAYALQSDVDARMLETLFGIPDYRYKVWLARHLIQQFVTAILLALLGGLCQLALADFPLDLMVFHLAFPIFFFSSTAFMYATITRSGNGTAAILVFLGLISWILSQDALQGSRWNLFYNPFDPLDEFAALLQGDTTFYNRLYLLVGSVLATLLGLLHLQRRERFI
jgi:hypothetical protein